MVTVRKSSTHCLLLLCIDPDMTPSSVLEQVHDGTARSPQRKWVSDVVKPQGLKQDQNSRLTPPCVCSLHFSTLSHKHNSGKVAMVPDREALSPDLELRALMTKVALTGLFHLSGIDYRVKTVTVDNSQVALQMWDTAGQER